MAPRSIAPGYEQIVVRIEDVDIPNRLCHTFDKTNSRIQVSWRDISGGGILRIPKQGEAWTAVRQGFVWRLKDRLNTADEHDEIVATAQPGDAFIDADTIYVNGHLLGRIKRENFTPSIPILIFQLALEPSNPDAVQVFINGLLAPTSMYTVDATDKQVIFTPDHCPPGNISIYYETTQPDA